MNPQELQDIYRGIHKRAIRYADQYLKEKILADFKIPKSKKKLLELIAIDEVLINSVEEGEKNIKINSERLLCEH